MPERTKDLCLIQWTLILLVFAHIYVLFCFISIIIICLKSLQWCKKNLNYHGMDKQIISESSTFSWRNLKKTTCLIGPPAIFTWIHESEGGIDHLVLTCTCPTIQSCNNWLYPDTTFLCINPICMSISSFPCILFLEWWGYICYFLVWTVLKSMEI